jgi:hypothetical protein
MNRKNVRLVLSISGGGDLPLVAHQGMTGGGDGPLSARLQPNPYALVAILAARSIALRFCRGSIVGSCKLAGRAKGEGKGDIH